MGDLCPRLSPDGSRLAFLRGSLAGAFGEGVWDLDLATGRVSELFRTEGPVGHQGNISVSPDERWILFVQNPLPQSELMLVDNFR